jgi:hypothetical protein
MHHFPYGFVQYLFSMQTVLFLHTFPLKYLWSPLLSLPSAFLTCPSPSFSPAFPLFRYSLFPLHSSPLLCSTLRSLFSSSRLSRYYVLLSLLLFSSSSLSLSTVLLSFSTHLFSSPFPLSISPILYRSSVPLSFPVLFFSPSISSVLNSFSSPLFFFLFPLLYSPFFSLSSVFLSFTSL